ncbi:hypothetical protein [Oryzobacter terrae]|uniref:hypothetical protein n=1 Tax=Oryzobacter terrae TaxID=1620385 RepID=UPI00366E5329
MDNDLTTSPSDGGELQVTLEAALVEKDAEREIDNAVTGRRGMARKYVRRLRRRHPDATPAEVIRMLEHHYVTAISAAGAAITVGSVAIEVGISLIPGGGAVASGGKAAAKGAGKAAAKKTAKETMKAAGKQAALGAAKTGAQRGAGMLPAGDAQLQFEITALFALAVADIHSLELDQQQAHALVYGLANGRVTQQQIATMATDLAKASDAGLVNVGQTIADGRKDWSHWANTLADSLPGGEAQSLVRGVQTGVLEDVRTGLDGKQQTAVEYGVGALVGGATRFVFGREVVAASRSAFEEAPPAFPDHLGVPTKPERVDDQPNRALEALDDAAKAVGAGVSTGAAAVGTGAVTAAGVVTRPFRWVDRDGDGVPDAPHVLTAAKAAGRVVRPFRSVDLDGDGVPDEALAVTAVRGVGKTIASPFRIRRLGRHAPDGGQPEPDLEPGVATPEEE